MKIIPKIELPRSLEQEDKYVPAREARKILYDMSGTTLMNYVNAGRIRVKKFNSRKFVYHYDDLILIRDGITASL